MRRRRRALSPAAVCSAGAVIDRSLCGLSAYRSASVVVAYCASENEVPVWGVIRSALSERKRVYLPRLRGEQMVFSEHRADRPLRPGPYGIPEPTGSALELREGEPYVVFVPLVAWDETGARLGRGGGFYDRALGCLPDGGSRIGVGYDFQQWPGLPCDAWDVRLDCVVSECGVTPCWDREGARPSRKEDTTRHDIRSHDRGRPRAGRGPGLGHRLPQATSD